MAVLDTEWRGVDDSKIRIFPSSVVRNDKKYTIPFVVKCDDRE